MPVETYRGYEIEPVVKQDTILLCPVSGWFYTLPATRRTLYHVRGPGVIALCFLPSMEHAVSFIDYHLATGQDEVYFEFFPGRR